MINEKIAEQIVKDIWDDVCGRNGFDLGRLDKDVQKEIKADWKEIIVSRLNEKRP